MKTAYPIILTKGKNHMIVFVPDFNINTQGINEADAMEMARDAIGLMGVDMQDERETLPDPSKLADVRKETEEGVVTLVDVDFDEYRRRNDMRAVKKNCTLPAWLNFEAEKAGVNFSAVLQTALKQELHLTER
jgi:predicted RNase H-like HicB family nuclease